MLFRSKTIDINLFDYKEREIHYISKAIDYACFLYRDRFRDQGEPFIVHPFRVAEIIQCELMLHISYKNMIVLILHDSLWVDYENTYNEIVNIFGVDIATKIKLFTKPHIYEMRQKQADDEAIFFKQFLKMEEELKYIKIADKFNNLREIHLANKSQKMVQFRDVISKYYLPYVFQRCQGTICTEFWNKIYRIFLEEIQ